MSGLKLKIITLLLSVVMAVHISPVVVTANEKEDVTDDNVVSETTVADEEPAEPASETKEDPVEKPDTEPEAEPEDKSSSDEDAAVSDDKAPANEDVSSDNEEKNEETKSSDTDETTVEVTDLENSETVVTEDAYGAKIVAKGKAYDYYTYTLDSAGVLRITAKNCYIQLYRYISDANLKKVKSIIIDASNIVDEPEDEDYYDEEDYEDEGDCIVIEGAKACTATSLTIVDNSGKDYDYFSVSGLYKLDANKIYLPEGIKIKALEFNNFSFTSFDFLSRFESTGFDSLSVGACHSLKNVNVPRYLKHVGICECNNLEKVEFSSDSSVKDLYVCECPKLNKLLIPENVTSLDYVQVTGAKNLKYFKMPSSIKRITEIQFANTGLRNIVLPSSVTAIDFEAFYNCTYLGKIVIPASVKIIDPYAFKACKNVKTVYYAGTEEQWNKIKIDKSYDHEHDYEGPDDDEVDYSQFTIKDVFPNAEIIFNSDVTEIIENISISDSSVTLGIGKTYQLTANATSDYAYKSSNPKIAKVSADGKITAVKSGNATITAYLKSDSDIKATCNVSVKYRMNYVLNGGTNNTGNPDLYTGTLKLKNPSKQYYTFKGWFTSSNFKTKTKVSSVKNANKTVYAKWAINTYNVKFNPNGGTGKAYTQKCTVTKTAALTANKFSRKGYTFVGWNTKADGSGDSYTNKQEILNLSTSNGATVNLYAQWSINTYNITYLGLTEGDTNPNAATTYQVTTPDIKLLSAARTNYTFNGWYTTSNFKNKTKATVIKKGSTGNKTYYAKFTLNSYTVKFNPNGGSGKAYTQKCNVTKTYTLTANKFSRKGYTFVGWNTKADGSGDSYTNKQEIMDLTLTNGQTINLYAQWSKNTYTINYVGLPAGANNPNPATYTVTTNTIKFKNLSIPGYSFKGWFTNTKYNKKATQISKGSTGTKTIYAKVVANKYNIAFNANGGTGSTAKMTNAAYGRSYNLRANGFSMEGYEFAGWNTQRDGSGTSYADMESVMNLTTKNGATVTLYAQWIPKADQPENT